VQTLIIATACNATREVEETVGLGSLDVVTIKAMVLIA
jgi:hypothetical protein